MEGRERVREKEEGGKGRKGLLKEGKCAQRQGRERL